MLSLESIIGGDVPNKDRIDGTYDISSALLKEVFLRLNLVSLFEKQHMIIYDQMKLLNIIVNRLFNHVKIDEIKIQTAWADMVKRYRSMTTIIEDVKRKIIGKLKISKKC